MMTNAESNRIDFLCKIHGHGRPAKRCLVGGKSKVGKFRRECLLNSFADVDAADEPKPYRSAKPIFASLAVQRAPRHQYRSLRKGI